MNDDPNLPDPAPPPDLEPVVLPSDWDDDSGNSHASLSFSGSGGLTLWSDPGMASSGRTASESLLSLHPNRPVVVGRQQGGEVPYLDPAYVPTRIVPETGQAVLTFDETGRDRSVSRGHFLLRAVADGLMMLNGVPRRGGGIRPPVNGTLLLEPVGRRMEDGEEYLIPKGKAARFELPNGTQVLIHAG